MPDPTPNRGLTARDLLLAAARLTPAQRAHLLVRFATAPWGRVVAALEVGHGPLLDVGCGPGLLAFLLERRGFVDAYLGVDPDPRKVERARAWLGESESRSFQAGRAGEVAAGGFGRAALVDVLYLVPRPERPALLSAVAERLGAGGRLVVLTSGGGPGWKRALDGIQERLATLLGVTRGAVVEPCDGEEVAALLRGAGFDEVRVEDAGAGYLHGFELVSARRGQPRAAA